MLIRAQEMARYVEDGILDAGLTGRDWIEEGEAKVHAVADLVSCQAKLWKSVLGFLAVPENLGFQSVKDLQGEDYRDRTRGNYEALPGEERSGGQGGIQLLSHRRKPPGSADAIVEVTETGSSLRANKLKIIDTGIEYPADC